MTTKKELERKNKELGRFSFLLVVIVIACIIMTASLSLRVMDLQPSGKTYVMKDPEKFVYAFPTPITEFINISTIDASCILDIRDYTGIEGGSVWVDIAPKCVEIAKHTYRKE